MRILAHDASGVAGDLGRSSRGILLSRASKAAATGGGGLALWCVAIFGTTLLDRLTPGAIDWLYSHVFDPSTRQHNATVSGTALLTGVFGFQPMAKFLAWLPWLLWIYALKHPKTSGGPQVAALAITTLLATAAILATSQRRPFVAYWSDGGGLLPFARVSVFRVAGSSLGSRAVSRWSSS